jgi:predicted nucleic acid-binding protein
MSAKCFVDTNVLVYAHDASTGDKHLRARALLERLWIEGTGVLSTQVLQEFYVNVMRKTLRPPRSEDARQWVRDYLCWEVVTNDGDTIIAAIDMQMRYQLSFWDALVLQSANEAAVELIYSEDLNDGQRYGMVTVVNPFR